MSQPCGHAEPTADEMAYALRAVYRAGVSMHVLAAVTGLDLSCDQARDFISRPPHDQYRWVAALLHTRLSEEIGGD